MKQTTMFAVLAGVGVVAYAVYAAKAVAQPLANQAGGNLISYSGGGLNLAIPNLAVSSLFGATSNPAGTTTLGIYGPGRNRWNLNGR